MVECGSVVVSTVLPSAWILQDVSVAKAVYCCSVSLHGRKIYCTLDEIEKGASVWVGSNDVSGQAYLDKYIGEM